MGTGMFRLKYVKVGMFGREEISVKIKKRMYEKCHRFKYLNLVLIKYIDVFECLGWNIQPVAKSTSAAEQTCIEDDLEIFKRCC